MEECRCPACGRPTSVPGILCSECSTSGYSQNPGNHHAPSLEDSERLERESLEDHEGLERSRPPTKEDLERMERVERWRKEMAPSSKPHTNDSPTDTKGQLREEMKTKSYTLSQVAQAAGRAVAAVGEDDLPLDGQREALELAKRWLLSLHE